MNNLHQCPNCKHKYSYWQKIRKIYFRFLWRSWKCENCGAELRIDPKRRAFNAIIFALVVFVLLQIKNIIIGILGIIVVSFILVLFDKIKLSD